MDITFDELLKYAKRTISVMRDNHGNLKKEYADLIEKVTKAMKQNSDLVKIVAKLRDAKTDQEIENIKKEFEEKILHKEEPKTEEEQISEIYGVNLESIEHVKLRSGKEYYKFYDNRTNRDFVLSKEKKGLTLSEEFKDIQNDISSAQGDNAEKNSEEIVKYERMNTTNEVHMYTVQEVKNNPQLLSNLPVERLKALSILLKNKDKLKIAFINPETGLAIDDRHRIVTAELNKNKDKYDVMYPQEYGYDGEIENNQDEEQNDFDTYSSKEINDVDVENNDQPKEIEEETIDEERVRLYYEYPEMLLKDTTLTPEEREKYTKAVETHKVKVETEQRKTDPPKVYVMKKPTKPNVEAGYVDALVLALTTGFVGGIITTIMMSIICK